MLICHCNIISDREIIAIIRDFLQDDPWQIIVPAKVYRELGKRGRCCGCFPSVVDLITTVTDEYHREIAAISARKHSATGSRSATVFQPSTIDDNPSSHALSGG